MGKFFKSAQYSGMKNIPNKKQSGGSTTSEGAYIDMSKVKQILSKAKLDSLKSQSAQDSIKVQPPPQDLTKVQPIPRGS